MNNNPGFEQNQETNINGASLNNSGCGKFSNAIYQSYNEGFNSTMAANGANNETATSGVQLQKASYVPGSPNYESSMFGYPGAYQPGYNPLSNVYGSGYYGYNSYMNPSYGGYGGYGGYNPATIMGENSGYGGYNPMMMGGYGGYNPMQMMGGYGMGMGGYGYGMGMGNNMQMTETYGPGGMTMGSSPMFAPSPGVAGFAGDTSALTSAFMPLVNVGSNLAMAFSGRGMMY